VTDSPFKQAQIHGTHLEKACLFEVVAVDEKRLVNKRIP
jgi:hypothetical protein